MGYDTPALPARDAETTEPEARAERFAHASDLGPVAAVLAARRDEVLDGWLAAAAVQPFHLGHVQRAVTDHMPRLYDALTVLLRRTAPRSVAPEAPLEDPAVLSAAQGHARMRLEQGLTATDVLTEFRLLRQEIGRMLRAHLADAAPATDVVGAELLVHDALDGAVFVALATLAQRDAERQRLYEAAEAARREAETAVRLRDQVLAAVAHDLRTPLAAISGHAQLAARRLRRAEPAPPVAAALSDLARVQVGAKRVARWVEALSDVARGSLGGPAPLDVQQVDLVALTEQVLAEHRQPGSRHRFRLETTAAPLSGRWDAGRLERVLHNLVGNAVKYSPDGGEIDVALGREGQPDAAGGYAVVRIGDHGLGIPAADLPHIFEPFRRGGNVAGFIEGSGIGLAGARQIVELHGGTIEAESAEGQGSTFTVRLPWQPPPDGEASEADEPGRDQNAGAP
jgi:signal transduction histidine kinase